MPSIETADGVSIFFKDWGHGRPVVFSHGWPLNADAWDNQLNLMATNGYRAIAHDRRGHGRSTQTGEGHDMDDYAGGLAAVMDALDRPWGFPSSSTNSRRTYPRMCGAWP